LQWRFVFEAQERAGCVLGGISAYLGDAKSSLGDAKSSLGDTLRAAG
jgi:hypothetical protein